MKEPKIMNLENYIKEDTPIIKPSKDSLFGLFVPQIVAEYGKRSGLFKMAFILFPYMIKTFFHINKSHRSLNQNSSLTNEIIEDCQLKYFESYAKKIGCSDIAYTKVPRNLIFKNKVILYDNAIVLTMAMKKDKMIKAPSLASSKEIWRAYATLGKIVNQLTSSLREEGFKAQAGPALGGETNYPLLAQKAGLGFIGKHGLLISRGNGSSQRLAVVYTNIKNLPFNDNNENSWIKDFCNSCNRCVTKCPSSAIFKNTIKTDGNHLLHIDYKKCAVSFSKKRGCSICIKECPFFKSDFDKIYSSYKKKISK